MDGVGIAEGLRLAVTSLPDASVAHFYDDLPTTTLGSELLSPDSTTFRAAVGMLDACFGERSRTCSAFALAGPIVGASCSRSR